jgi:hypothetical protein
MLDVLPVVAQEENRTGHNPATARRNKGIAFIFLAFSDMLVTAMRRRGAFSLPGLGMWKFLISSQWNNTRTRWRGKTNWVASGNPFSIKENGFG